MAGAGDLAVTRGDGASWRWYVLDGYRDGAEGIATVRYLGGLS